MVLNTQSQTIYLNTLPVFKFLKKKKFRSYKLKETKVDCFGTRIDWFEKKTNAKSIDTVKLYYPKQESIIKETADVCQKCKEGYLIYHPVEFANKTYHVQSSCNTCHRYNAFIGKFEAGV